MPKGDIVVVGTSAGGVEALIYLVKHLPTDFKLPVVIVLHLPKHGTEVLSSILNRNSKLPVSIVKDGETIKGGKIYVAPPDRHVTVRDDSLKLNLSPRENNQRPAIDPLFRTASRFYGERTIAVLLTGTLDDGTSGLKAVKMRNGVVIVQHPEDAMYPEMPCSAIENVDDIDYILKLSQIPDVLIELANKPVETEPEDRNNNEEVKSDLVEFDLTELGEDDRPDKTSVFICPDCGGPLWEIKPQGLLRYRCRIGHAYSIETLLARKSDDLEDALWLAMRVLEEKATLTRKVALRMRSQNQISAAQRLEEQEQDAIDRAKVIQRVIYQNNNSLDETIDRS